MKTVIVMVLLLFTRPLQAAESVQMHVELTHTSAGGSGWKLDKTAPVPFSTTVEFTSIAVTAAGQHKVLRVTPIKRPNGLVEIKLEYLYIKSGVNEKIQESTIITKVGEAAELVTGGDQDRVMLKVVPERVI